MTTGKFYTHRYQPGFVAQIKFIITNSKDGLLLNVSWWSKNTAGILINSGIDQEVYVPRGEIGLWQEHT